MEPEFPKRPLRGTHPDSRRQPTPPCSKPGCIDDPLLGRTNRKASFQALNYEDWVLNPRFEADDALARAGLYRAMRVRGLDTIATVSLNW